MLRSISVGLGLCVLTGCLARPQVQSAASADERPQSPVVAAAPERKIEPAPLVVATARPRPRLEVVFVLDTTGSMASLLEGAKQKIWSIADALASAQPTPDLSIGLIAYRDRGDDYVTQRFELSDDIDAVYERLHALGAGGGGDGPESVNQALFEAVNATAWSTEPHVYRTIFLVGDAPPHMDYANDVPYPQTVRAALDKGIVINTVQCGDMQETTPVWASIAQGTQGSYAAIAQGGGMVAVAAPMDGEIERLNAELAGTIVPYGAAEAQQVVRDKAAMASSAPAAASASRHAYLGKKGGGIVTGSGDLVDDVNKGRVKLADVKRDQLPEPLRALSPEQQQVELEKRKQQRASIETRLDGLVRARGAFVKSEEKRRREAGEAAGFDAEVMKAVKSQAEKAGLHYAE